MRARLAFASAAALALGGCSFLLSEEFAAEDTPPPTEAGADTATESDAGPGSADAPVSDANVDARIDTGDAALDPSLVAFWTFDNDTSLTQKDETQRYDMVLTGATIVPNGGIRGGAALFGGSDGQRVDALSNANFPKAGTVSIWFKHSFTATDTGSHGLFDDWQGDRAHLFVRHNGSDAPERVQVALQSKSDAGGYAWAQSFDAVKDQWTHLVLTWHSTGRTAALYVNGVVVKASSFVSSETFDPFEQYFQISDGWVGSVDEVRLYNRVLTQAEALLVP